MADVITVNSSSTRCKMSDLGTVGEREGGIGR